MFNLSPAEIINNTSTESKPEIVLVRKHKWGEHGFTGWMIITTKQIIKFLVNGPVNEPISPDNRIDYGMAISRDDIIGKELLQVKWGKDKHAHLCVELVLKCASTGEITTSKITAWNEDQDNLYKYQASWDGYADTGVI
jgi:hypothetical protein